MYCTYLHTHKQPRGGGAGRYGGWVRVMGLWVITGDIIWVIYSGEEASKPTEGIKKITAPSHAFPSRSDRRSSRLLTSRRRLLLNKVVSCIQCRSYYSDSRASKWSNKSSDAVWCDALGSTAPFFREELQTTLGGEREDGGVEVKVARAEAKEGVSRFRF